MTAVEEMNSASAALDSVPYRATGPTTKITNLGAVKIVLGARRFALYLAFTVLFALATGCIADILF